MLYNHLKDKDTQNLFLEVAYGLHIVEGDLCKSIKEGSDIYVQHKLGRGEWNKCRSLWWRGFGIQPSDYRFHPGALSSGYADPVQGTDEIFSMDIPHSLTAWTRAKLPSDYIDDLDPAVTAPEGLYGIYETSVIKDYNNSGIETDYSYSANPAREVADLFLVHGKRNANRIDWGAWAEWRDYLDELILCDYRDLDIEGFGLSAKFYNGNAFNTLISERVDAIVEFALSEGTPAYGLDDAFSARWEGYIKPRFTENYTLTLTFNDNAYVYIDEVLVINGTTAGTLTANVALTAAQYHEIKVEWADGGGDAEIRLEWESAGQPKEVIPSDRLYPKEKMVPRWESHIAFKRPTRLDDAVRAVLRQCNSGVQRVNGKYRFFCYEQLSGSGLFSFSENNYYPNTLEVEYADLTQIRNVLQGTARDLDHQYLSNMTKPIVIERQNLIEQVGRRIDGELLEFQNTTRFQLFRLLEALMKRAADAPDRIRFDGNAETYPVLKSDRVKFNCEYLDIANADYKVFAATDKSAEKTADDRSFVLKRYVE